MAAAQLTTSSPLAVKSLPSFEGLRSAKVITNVNFSLACPRFKSRAFRGLVVNAASVSAVKVGTYQICIYMMNAMMKKHISYFRSWIDHPPALGSSNVMELLPVLFLICLVNFITQLSLEEPCATYWDTKVCKYC